MFPVVLACSTHHQKVASAEIPTARWPGAASVAATSDLQRPGCSNTDNGDNGVGDLIAVPVAVPSNGIFAVAVQVEAD